MTLGPVLCGSATAQVLWRAVLSAPLPTLGLAGVGGSCLSSGAGALHLPWVQTLFSLALCLGALLFWGYGLTIDHFLCFARVLNLANPICLLLVLPVACAFKTTFLLDLESPCPLSLGYGLVSFLLIRLCYLLVSFLAAFCCILFPFIDFVVCLTEGSLSNFPLRKGMWALNLAVPHI